MRQLGAFELAVPLAAALGLAVLLGLGANHTVFFWINGFSRWTGDALWSNLTLCGDTLVVLSLLLPFARQQRQWLWACLLAALLASVWTHVPKHFWPMPRPAGVLAPDLIHIIGPVLKTSSFPSGHTTAIFTLAGLLALGPLQKNWQRALVLLLAVLVGLSRSAVGAHWPQDLLAGAFGGWLSALLALRWSAHWRWPETKVAAWIGQGILLACSLSLFWHETGYPAVKPLQYLIAISTLALWGYQVGTGKKTSPPLSAG